MDVSASAYNIYTDLHKLIIWSTWFVSSKGLGVEII